METAEQTEAIKILFSQNHILLTTSSESWPTSARLCFFRVFSGLITNIRVHSCPFVVPFIKEWFCSKKSRWNERPNGLNN